MIWINTFLWAVIPWIVLIHACLFLAFWLTNRLYYSTTNDFLWHLSGRRRDYIRMGLVVSGAAAVWSSAQVLFARAGMASRPAVFLGVLSLPAELAYLAFFYSSFRMLFRHSPSQLGRIAQGLGYFRLLFDTLLLWAIALAASVWLGRAASPSQIGGPGEPAAAPGMAALCVAAYLLVWILPLVFPPGSVYRGALPVKPRIIAHRGASMLAPENTLASARRAVELGAYGVETDVRISLDGVPFLMHDDTLQRTTNVAEVFPGMENQLAETFTLAELRRLDAGSWFARQDPFRTIGSKVVSQEQRAGYRGLAIAILEEQLELVRRAGLVLIFDLKQPPEGHPYRGRYFELVFQQVKGARIDDQIWFLADGEQAKTVREAAPRMELACGVDYRRPAPAEDLRAAGYGIANADFGLAPAWMRRYQRAGLHVNLFTVEEPWQFSRLWLLGVNSVTTSNAAAMLALARPVCGLPYGRYIVLWSLLGLAGLALALAGQFL